MTRPHFTRGRLAPVRLVLLHATAGVNSYGWLRHGGSTAAPVSCHYLISKAGQIWQFVREADTAWHAGASTWRDYAVNGSLNACSVGIELENLNNGIDPYPEAQLAAATALVRDLLTRYALEDDAIVRHRDVSPGRKTDPAPPAFDWPAFRSRLTPVVMTPYTATSPILGVPLGTAAQARYWFTQRSTQYAPSAIAEIVAAYEREGSAVGLDWFLALAQCAHESGSLTSWWCARPRRNPAGLGVTGYNIPGASDVPPGAAWAWRDGQWWEGLSFARWDPDAVRAHLGRLLAYAMPPGDRFGPVQAMVDEALSLRPLPLRLHGAAPTLQGLGGTWAVPGTHYATAIASIANRMRGL